MTRRGVLKAFTGVIVAVVLLVAACAGWIAWITRDQRPAILRGLDRSLVISERQAPNPGMRIPNTLPALTHRILKDHPIGSDGSRLASDLKGMGFEVFDPEGMSPRPDSNPARACSSRGPTGFSGRRTARG